MENAASYFVPPDEDNADWNNQDASQLVEVLLEEVNHDGGSVTRDEMDEWLKENEESIVAAASGCGGVWSVEEPLDEDDMDSVFESLLRWGRKRAPGFIMLQVQALNGCY